MSDLSSYPYISSYNFMLMADQLSLGDDHKRCAHPDFKNIKNSIDPSKVEEGDILYVITDNLKGFFKNTYPFIRNPFILISGRTDRGLTTTFKTDKIIRWYTSNLGVRHDKIEAIPLGIQNRHWKTLDNPEGDPSLLNLMQLENIEKDKDVLMGFQPRSNPGERQPIWNKFNGKNWVTTIKYGKEQRADSSFRMNYYKEIKRHRFVLCPQGAGYDCHRNWETWALGSFPIIKKHISMEAFYDMPAWFVDSWNEVTPENIKIKYYSLINDIESGKKTFNKAFFDHWQKKIKSSHDIRVG